MTTSIILETPEDFLRFSEIYQNKSKNHVSADYLAKCAVVRVFIDTDGNWQAGYCVNNTLPIRYFESFPADVKSNILQDKNLYEKDIVEIGCIWMNRSVLLMPGESTGIYISSLEDALQTEKEIVIGGSRIKTVWQKFETALTHELFFGKVPFGEELIEAKIVYANSAEIELFCETYV